MYILFLVTPMFRSTKIERLTHPWEPAWGKGKLSHPLPWTLEFDKYDLAPCNFKIGLKRQQQKTQKFSSANSASRKKVDFLSVPGFAPFPSRKFSAVPLAQLLQNCPTTHVLITFDSLTEEPWRVNVLSSQF